MKITVNTKVLQHEHLSLADFLVMLIGYYSLDYRETLHSLIDRGILQQDLSNKDSMILSDNNKNLVTRILLESNPKVISTGIDFTSLAQKLQSIYPSGVKDSTTYSWQGKTNEIKQKLMTLVVVHDFTFTEAEAIHATEEYVHSFPNDKKHMQLLKYFILKTSNHDGPEINSMFMTIIENNRQQ